MAEQIFKKQTDWGQQFDFAADGELLVTITLAEYRELVSNRVRDLAKSAELYNRIAELEEQVKKDQPEAKEVV